MVKKSCITLVNILLVCISFAQEIQFKEKATAGYTRFFYDDNYYLVDKNCEFKSIERVAQYDTVNLKFNGEFKDFNLNGRLILQGAYRNGLKHGAYKAYHTNGQIKWESTYVNNKENGLWKYYYPDGKTMLTLSFENEDFRFVDFWDKFGNQKITNGEGEFEMIFPIKGFTDHGFTSYHKKGKIVQGKLEGNWTTSFTDNERSKTIYPIFLESYKKGEQQAFYPSEYFEDEFISYEDFYIVPSEFFSRAELFIVHGCDFDSYSGFISHLTKKFNSYLKDETFVNTDTTFEFRVVYNVSNKGLVNSMKVLESPQGINASDLKKINDLFRSVDYFIPSVTNGKPIRDNLTLIGNFIISKENTILQHLKVEREIGQ